MTAPIKGNKSNSPAKIPSGMAKGTFKISNPIEINSPQINEINKFPQLMDTTFAEIY